MKLAIVNEWMNVYGGAERKMAEILDLYPQAELHALIHNPRPFIGTPLEGKRFHTTFMQRIPRVEDLYRGLLPLMPLAIESMNVHQYDMVLSISHAVAHGVKTSPDQIHVSYICTPMRYAWHLQDDYMHLHHLDRPFISSAARAVLGLLRRWDRSSASRADHLIANSKWTAERIRDAWKRDSRVIYPPVNVRRFRSAETRDDYYLYVSRLVPYKMAAEIILAFNQLKLPLVIVGDGPEMPRLQKLAGENVKLLGYQPDDVVTDLMNHAKGFVYMAVEDFGIAMVEAQAAGAPVIAHARGGAAEIVRDQGTGLLFSEQTAESMIDAVLRSRDMKLNSRAAHENAARFSRERFRQEFTAYIESVMKA
jgi:glycosyltransferase involved in cell wall biosynthesis